MTDPGPNHVTRLLGEIRDGDPSAAASLAPLVHDELKKLAEVLFSTQPRCHTLQPTALVNEAWIKLARGLGRAEDRTHFFSIASKAMRQILRDHAKRIRRQKRGSGKRAVTLHEEVTPLPGGKDGLDLVELDEALTRLAALNERHARIVELRILGSLTLKETAEALGVAESTVVTEWVMARGWLRRELETK